MSKRALIVFGGWDGHEPEQVAHRFRELLEKDGFQVQMSQSLESMGERQVLKTLDLLVPVWTMGEIPDESAQTVADAVESGLGLAGCHGGLCDAFRGSPLWQFVTGGQWVAHPGDDGVTYTVNLRRGASPLTEGIEDFQVTSEQYYLHVDPAADILATTRFPVVPGPHDANGPVDMPVAWTKRWGKGRVYYSSLGHHNAVFDTPQALEMIRRGFLWAARD